MEVFKLFLFVLFCLLWGEDEPTYSSESIQLEDFDLEPTEEECKRIMDEMGDEPPLLEWTQLEQDWQMCYSCKMMHDVNALKMHVCPPRQAK